MMGRAGSVGALMATYLAELRAIDCPVCGGGSVTAVGARSRGGLAIRTVVCAGCGLIFLNPKPPERAYRAFYTSGDYRRFLDHVKGRDGTRDGDRTLADRQFEKRKADGRETARRYLAGLLGPGDLYFDFGCDLGGIMAGVAAETGCDVMGNEPSERCAGYIRETIGIEILNSTMEDIGDADRQRYRGRVKVGSIIGVLEHVNDPVRCLGIVSDMLVDGGFLYVESFDIFRRMETKSESVDDIATIDHQYYFHRDAYLTLLARCGFEAVRFDYAGRKGDMMRALARKTGRPGAPAIPRDPGADPVATVLRLNAVAVRHRRSAASVLRRMRDRSIRRARRLGAAVLARLGRR